MRPAASALALSACLAVLAQPFPTAARAAEGDSRPDERKAGWADLSATAFVGDGLRFNNPYRLTTVLGSQAQSLSRTAAYVDLGGALLFGDPAWIAHGLSVRVSTALEGIPQAVMTASYEAMHRWGPWGAYARAGHPLVLGPDSTWGFEGGLGGVWFVRAGMGIAAELVGDLFYGAGTREVATPAYPVLSAQAGLVLSWEVMP
jgi:hypothetical protein